MKHVGLTIKQAIEDRGLKKYEVAQNAGITYKYLTEVYRKESLDARILERLCKAIGISVKELFEDTGENESGGFALAADSSTPSDVRILYELLRAKDELIENQRHLIAEKERTIQLLTSSRADEAASSNPEAE